MRKTAFVYDPFNLRHTREGHPENYRRLEETWSLLEADGILDRLQRVPSSPAPMDAVLRVHTPQYVERLQNVTLYGGGHLDADTYLNEDSYEAALLAAGGLLNVVDCVLEGRADNGFALVRPPGHHALSFQGMGFCLLANAAIAARWAQDRHGLERVLIVDFDVHHGNGTQDIFYGDPDILFFSAHQFPYYPGTGAADETGDLQAAGSTVNVPFSAYVGDQGYVDAFRRILRPLVLAFKPELILLSAGYDAHWMDPLASMSLSIAGYAQLVRELLAIAEDVCAGRLVCVLEGGYHVDVLAHSILTTLRVLNDEDARISDPFGPAPGRTDRAQTLLERLANLHGVPSRPFYSTS